MKRFMKNKNGQFVIIAVLMIAIMIISIGALMHRAVTYYKHEPWEEYLTLIGSIELNSRSLVELSLANYTNTDSPDLNILRTHLEKWQINLTRIYPGYGITLNYTLIDSGLVCDWNKNASFSAANTTFDLNINSIGLKEFKFNAVAHLNLTILNVNNSTNEITATVKEENEVPIFNLKKDNFLVEGSNITSVTSSYDEQYMLVYIIIFEGTITTPVTVAVWDQRGIKVTARYSTD